MASPFVFAAALFSLLIYVLVARNAVRHGLRAPKPLPRDYFLARHRYGGEEFAAAQIAYQLQMSTVYPFVLWAATGDWILAVWNTLFYLLGIALFVLLIGRFRRNTLNLVESSHSVHALVGNLHRSIGLRRLTALMSVLAFAGLAVFEIVWGATAFKVLFGGSSAIYYLAIAVLTVYLIVYFWVGGQGATIRTDQYQLLLGYIGLHALVAWCISRPTVNPSKLAAPFLVTWTIILTCAMLVWRLAAWRPGGRAQYLRVLNIITLVSVATMLAVLVYRSAGSWGYMITIPRVTPTDPHAYRWQLATLALLPLFFQFVDMTNWQRIASLKNTSDLRKGLIQYLLESPLSWLLPVLIGMCLPSILGAEFKGDAWVELLTRVCADHSLFGIFLASIIVVAVIAIFMSTAESLISAIGYAYAYDLNQRSRDRIDQGDEEKLSEPDRALIIRIGRRAMAVILSAVVACFVVVDLLAEKGTTFLGLFLSFYTPMLAFAPALLIPAITGRVARGVWAWVSLAGGAFVGIGCGIVSLSIGGVSQWISAPAVLVVSWLAYLIGIVGGPRLKGEGARDEPNKA
jgi:hypothetical protein